MGYILEVTNFRLLLSARTSNIGVRKKLRISSIDFHKRSILGRNNPGPIPGLGTKFRDQSLQASKL